MIEKQKKDRYEMHKYWGKKPSAHLKELIETYSGEGDVILDPFSGYGVFCCEAYLLNRNVISNDLNPIANFINHRLLSKDLNIEKLTKEWGVIKSQLEPFINKWYGLNLKDETVQLISILRDKSDKPIKVRFKSVNNKRTEEIYLSQDQINEFINFENSQEIEDWYPKNKLIENSRISAKKGMVVSDLFTKRTLACHSKLLKLIESKSSGEEQQLLKLAFTANLANCSKLVPPIKSRGEMSQGAWMTGFYVGDTYIENNVLQYFENRLNKIIKGKKDYLKFFNNPFFNYKNTYKVTQFDAKLLDIGDNSVDYIFADPPYGDAVPYFEQSVIWNSWLRLEPEYKNEIVVSDSKFRSKKITDFESDINKAFVEIRRVLKSDGYFSLTYHSLSGLEWRAITNACIYNGFEMISFKWLTQKNFTPRQINRYKSVKGDVLVTFKKSSEVNFTILDDNQTEMFFKQNLKSWLSRESLDTNEVFLRIMKLIFAERIIIGSVDLYKTLVNNFHFTKTNQWSIK
ncbi:DNA methyltransferase [Bergeriella denitrificans]|uniref:Putative methyltransferase n=1 Tax=Bergeriella denitrificans TaxID=494 RepID=A0A378UJE7_BERDE|nr:DNA methyltransferase [Bergeriella denitrificans]STZ76853.1 putative methyltransferase [Bergeriella denitrificans]